MGFGRSEMGLCRMTFDTMVTFWRSLQGNCADFYTIVIFFMVSSGDETSKIEGSVLASIFEFIY